MKKTKKWIALLLVLTMVLTLFTGCGGNNTANNDKVVESRTVIDATEREIIVPGEINRVVIMSTMPLCSVYCMAGGDPDKIVGLTPESKNAAVNSFLSQVADLSDVSTAFAEGEAVNVEEVMNLNPDVVFYNSWHAGDSAAAAKLEELGVACVGFTTDIPSAIESVSTWATLIGQVLGTEMQADKIVAYGQDVEKMVMDRVAQIPEEERRSALILANYNASGISAAGTTFGRYWLATIGAENVALELTQKVAPVSLEQIYAWDPEYIFLNSFSAFTAEDLMTNNAIAGHDWSGLTAVQNGHVYKMPLGMYYWFAPCSDSPLALQWLAKHLYPEQFTDIDMDAEIKDYFKEFYGVTLSDEDLHTLYNPPAESAM